MASFSIKVKFLIDKEQKRVVFAEAGSDFVDILLSFLTLPLETIVRLLNYQSGLGSLDNFYHSVAQLDEKHPQKKACKEMLLNPWCPPARICHYLKINYIHELYPTFLYRCDELDCLVLFEVYYACTSKVPCGSCNRLMGSRYLWSGNTLTEGGLLFDRVDFIVTDDLRVMPSSIAKGLSILKELQIEDASILEERVIEFGTKEVLNLLGRSLISKNALTEFCFPEACVEASGDCFLSNKDEIVAGEAKTEVENEIILELFLNKRNNEVLFAEVGDNFVNFLFSFLTYPLGAALGFLSDNISPLCASIQNVYSSAMSMSSLCFNLKICREVLTPKLSTFYEYNTKILKLKVPFKEFTESCAQCPPSNGCKPYKISPCPHEITRKKFNQQNPKSGRGVCDIDRAYMSFSKRFLISDNLRVSPLSLISHMCNETDFPISELVRKEVSIDKTKALSLLRALLVSKKVLTDVFFPKLIGRHRNWENEK